MNTFDEFAQVIVVLGAVALLVIGILGFAGVVSL